MRTGWHGDCVYGDCVCRADATSTAFVGTPLAFGAMILLSMMGIVLFQAVVVIERVFFPGSSGQDTVVG